MKPITPPLRSGDEGPAVANLQEALVLLLNRGVIQTSAGTRQELLNMMADEAQARQYRDASAKSVAIFQQGNHLHVTGEVDQPTADALNQALKALGAFDTPPQDIQKRVVAGQVMQEDQTPFRGTVVLFHDGDQGSVRLGEDVTGADGHYTIRYEPLPGVDSVNARVAALDETGRTAATSEVVRDAGPIQVIDMVVPVVQPDTATRRVDGRIAFDHGAPAEGLTVRLYRLGFGGAEAATRLAETTTLQHGVYSLPYALDGQAANLEVRAVDSAGNEVPLSKIVRNADEREVLNLVAPAAARPMDAEFTRLSTDLQPHIGDLSRLQVARETAEQQDLTLLHEASGWDARLIATAALATRLSAPDETGLPQDALYGLLRVGLPSDKLQLAQVSSEAFDQALSKAWAAGIVQINEADVPQIKKDFETFSVKTRLAVPAPGSQATYGEMLSQLNLSEDDQNTFAKLYLDNRGDAQSLWDNATNAGLGAVVPKLQLQGKLAFLTTNNPTLTASLQADLGDAEPAQLVKMGLYKKEAWLDRIGDVPAAYAGADNPKDAYAEDMARKVRISYSTEVTWNMIDSGELVIEGGNADLSAALRKAIDKGFKLGQTAIDPFLKANPDVLDGIADSNRRTTTDMIKTLQRVYQITPGNDAMKALLNAGLLSAQDVLAYPLDVFLERFGALFPSDDQARLVYQKAEQVSNITYSLFSLAKELDSSPPLFAMSASPEVRQAAKQELVKHFPTMESLFGSLDYCECEECRSVLSPAAYLVDLLQFLDRDPKVWQNTLTDWKAKHGTAPYPFRSMDAFNTFLARWRAAHPGEPDPNTERTPYEILIDRRPDLPHIPLTCENTNTALPQIDLVNEILEYYVANNALHEDAARDTGDATTAELLAEPQYVITEAYGALQQALYPLALPFDLWIEIARAFSAYFDVPLSQLLETFRARDDLFAPTEAYDRAAVFFESLGLAPAEIAIFTDPNPLAAWFKLYGFDKAEDALTEAVDADTGQRIDLNSAKALSRRLGVTYQEIADIVETAFVNPALPKLALLYKLGVSIADARFYTTNKALYDLNKDLVGKARADLSPADQQRFDDLYKPVGATQLSGWDVVAEVAAFEGRLADLAATFNTPLADLQATIESLPFDKVLVLADPDAGCDFDATLLQHADGQPATAIDFLRINVFVRLRRKLGWSIDETDRALTTFIPQSAPFDENPANLARQPLKTALIYVAHLKALDEAVRVGDQSRFKLLTLWSDIATTGNKPLYAQLFLARSVVKGAEVEVVVDGKPRRLSVFDDPLGSYLVPTQLARIADQVRYEARLPEIQAADQINAAAFAGEARVSVRYDELGEVQFLDYVGVLTDAEKDRLNALAPSDALSQLLDAVQAQAQEFTLIKGHMLSLQGALGLTADEIGRVLEDAGSSVDEAALSLPSVSTLYRYRLLAKALGLSVSDLIALKQLAGIDPFKPLAPDPLATIEDDYPFSQTLRFVEVAQAVLDAGWKVEDLDYLVRHRFDEAGKYRSNRDATLAWLKTVADGVRAIRVEQAVPDDPGALSEDVLRQKLGLVLPADVVERFVALMNGTAEATGVQAVAAANRLDPADFAGEGSIRVLPYNGAKGSQSLVLRGVLSDAQKGELEASFNGPLSAGQQATLAALLDAAQAASSQQANEFFARYLKKQPLNDSVTTGFLEAADFDKLLAPLPPIGDNLTPDQQTAARQANEGQRQKKLAILANAFLPFLQRRLIRQFLVQAIVAYTAAEPVLVESLLTDARVLHGDGDAPLLTSLEALGVSAVSAAFFDSPDLTGQAQKLPVVLSSADTALKAGKDADGNALNPANSARFDGYLTVPTSSAYRFTIELEKQNAEATLAFDHLPTKVFLHGIAPNANTTLGIEPDEFLELKASTLYHFTLELKSLAGGRARVLVQGETLAQDDLSQLTLYPGSVMDGAEDAVLLLTKALQLVQSLELSEREIRYVLTHAGDFGNVSLSELPTQTVGDTDAEKKATEERFAAVLRLTTYSRLKRDLVGGTDDLIGVFEANTTGDLDHQVYPLIARLTRRNPETVKTTARALARSPEFKSEEPLARLWEGLQVVERFGVPVNALVEWTRIVSPTASPAQRSDIARDLKEAIKARFEPDAWLRVAQPIFDRLRQRQRDALVAHVMHQHDFERIEQLFEFFLIDPGVEPVVQTSRIRSAVGAVQIFIHRCLLNLEPQVAPAAINSKQWQWMKRYPVWAGNRKLWLFPENVLEPEFRDDKTHLFTELEGHLLQSDVSNDVAEDAFFTYLKKLEELARLDIVAMYCEEQPLDPTSNQLHVIGRTYLEPFRYFYRRYSHEMWTPWEPMPVEIEGHHIVPVVWRDRLNVFWVTFIDNLDPNAGASDDKAFLVSKEAVQSAISALRGTTMPSVHPSAKDPTSQKLTEVSVGQIASGVRSAMNRKLVKVQLHWSEYFQGEWSVRESGGYSASLIQSVPLDFDSMSVFIHASKEFDDDGAERAVRVHLGGAINQAFRVVSRHSRPTRVNAEPVPSQPYNAPEVQANRYRGSGPFKVTFTQRIETQEGKGTKTTSATPSILQEGEGFTLLPSANRLSLGTPEIASLVTPVFYQDDRSNTFFVEPTFKEKTIEEWQEWVTHTPRPEVEWDHPEWWDNLDLKPLIPKPKLPIPVHPDDPIWQSEIDPRARFGITDRQDWLANPATVVQFDGELVGPAGRAGLAIQPALAADGALDSAAPAIAVNAGSAIGPGQAVVAVDSSALASTGLAQGAAGLNIIGGSGLNSALLKNVSALKGR
ncbi:MAG: neuraminidase-like domain-containing protein [Anaerolineae bacterium]